MVKGVFIGHPKVHLGAVHTAQTSFIMHELLVCIEIQESFDD